MNRGLVVFAISLLIAACGPAGDPVTDSPGGPPSAPTTPAMDPTAADPASIGPVPLEQPTVQLVDSTIPPAVAGEDGWMYQQSADGDLDGDSQLERVVLTARVELIGGRPAWDDGQPWQVYVQEADGTRTYLFARYVQLGTLTMRVALPESDRGPAIILIEHLPDQLSLYEVEYRAPGSASAIQRFQRMVDPRGELAGPALP